MKKVELEPLSENNIKQTNETISDVIELEDSPFTVVRVDDKYFLALGKYRLSELLSSEEEARAEVEDLSWTRLLSVIHAVATECYKHEESLKEAKKINPNK